MTILLAPNNPALEHLARTGTDFHTVEHEIERLREENTRLKTHIHDVMADLTYVVEHLRKTQIELNALRAEHYENI